MTKDEAMAAWDVAKERLLEVQARHKIEMTQARKEWRAARDAFIDAYQQKQGDGGHE
jgi:hypothetical protein